MSRHSKATAYRPVRYDRLLQENGYDAYKTDLKYAEPTVCPECHAVFQNGRWQWGEGPAVAHAVQCPACRRTEEKFPIGYVHVTGEYFQVHEQEILRLIDNETRKEQAEHPMERIIDKTPEDEGMLVTTTGFHLARRLGEALHNAHQGELGINYNDAEDMLRVYWRR